MREKKKYLNDCGELCMYENEITFNSKNMFYADEVLLICTFFLYSYSNGIPVVH